MKLSFLLWLASFLPQSAADPLCLATTVYLEARGQSQLGQRAVAEVALRRKEDGRWGESVCEVVTAPKQFAPTLVNSVVTLDENASATFNPLAHAADRIAFGKCFNGGQTCVAPDYVLVPRAQRDEFVTAYMDSVRRRYPTLADNPDYTVTVNARQATRLRSWLADAQQRGVQVVQHAPAGESTPAGLELIPPTVLLDPPDEATVMREEIFGPLLPVKSYDSHEEAIAYVLARDKPLAFYAFDNDAQRRDASLDRVSAGMACINDVVIQFGQNEFPIGGVGASGMGSYHGHTGFLTFSKAMPVLYQSRLNGMKLLDAPYGSIATRLVGWLTR